GSRKELAKVVARHVFHNTAARLDCLSAAGDCSHPEEMIARGTGFNPAWPGQIGGDDAAESAVVRLATQQWPVVDGLKSQLLVVFFYHPLHFAQRRPAPPSVH